MISRMLRSGIVGVSVIALLAGCAVELRSPIKISRVKDEEQPSPHHAASAPPRKTAAATPTASPAPMPAYAADETPYEPPVSSPEHHAAAYVPVISEYYLTNTPYDVLGEISVTGASDEGFSKDAAKAALGQEAYRRFGSRAKAIINVAYEQDSRLFGADTIQGARGSVVTWQETTSASPSAAVAPATAKSQAAPERPAPSLAEEEPPETEFAQPARPYQAPPPASPGSGYQPAQQPKGVSSPAGVLILTDQDLVDYTFWVTGKISVFSKSDGGFSMDEANRALKAEAFRRYGGQARGIINVAYTEKKGLFDWGGDGFSEASGDVVNWNDRGIERGTEMAGTEAGGSMQPHYTASGASPEPSQHASTAAQPTAPPLPLYEPPTSSEIRPRPAPPGTLKPATILVVSPDSLVNKDIKFLGKIKVQSPSGKGLDEKRTIELLKAEASKRYGNQAKAITNVEYERQVGILNLNKYGQATADAITWGTVEDAPPAEAPTPALASPYYSRAEDEDIPDYSAAATSYMDIQILDTDDLLITQYQKLGAVEYETPDRWGIKPFEADIALQREAFNTYGGKARALINVQYTSATGYNVGPDKVIKAQAEVITW